MNTKEIIDALINLGHISEDPGIKEATKAKNTFEEIMAETQAICNTVIFSTELLLCCTVEDTLKLANNLRDKTQYLLWELSEDCSTVGKASKDEKDKSSKEITISMTSEGLNFNVLSGTTEDCLLGCLINLRMKDHFHITRLKECAKCGKHFYQHYRKNQKFCSKSCSDMGRRGTMHKSGENL